MCVGNAYPHVERQNVMKTRTSKRATAAERARILKIIDGSMNQLFRNINDNPGHALINKWKQEILLLEGVENQIDTEATTPFSKRKQTLLWKLRSFVIATTHDYARFQSTKLENKRIVEMLKKASSHKTSDHLDYDWPVKISQEQIAKDVDCYCNLQYEHAITFMNEGKRWQG